VCERPNWVFKGKHASIAVMKKDLGQFRHVYGGIIRPNLRTFNPALEHVEPYLPNPGPIQP